MPANQWDHSSILLSNNSGANIGRGIQQVGQAFGKGIEKYYEAKQQREKEEATVDWLDQNEEAVNQLFPQLAKVKDPMERKKVIKAGIKGAGLENLVQVKAFTENQKRQAAQDEQIGQLRGLQINQAQQQQAEQARRMEEMAGINARADRSLMGAGTKGIIRPEVQADMIDFASSPAGQLRKQGVQLTPELMMQVSQDQLRYGGRELPKPQSTTGKLLADLNLAKAEGRAEDVKYLKAALDEEILPSGMMLETGPNGQFIFKQGKGSLTTQSTTQSQERQYQSERVMKEGAELLSKLRPEDLGFAGVVQESFINKGLAQIVPGMADSSVSARRTQLRQFREVALKTISSDSRFSNTDRKAIESLLPEDGVFESYPSARAKLYAAIELMSRRSSTEAERRGEKSLADATPEELLEMGRSGKVPKEQAAALLHALHPDFVTRQKAGTK